MFSVASKMVKYQKAQGKQTKGERLPHSGTSEGFSGGKNTL